MQQRTQAAVLLAAVLTVSLTATWHGAAAFQLFGGHGSGHGGSGGGSGGSAVLGESVKMLVRTVDAPDPYYRSMSFFVPKELNYMMGEYLHKNFTQMLERHCNVTNITMIVRNDVQLLLSDYDVWTMRNGDRIEIWSKRSGSPTRATTAMAFAQKFRRPGPPCVGPACRRGNRGDKWKTAGGDEGVSVPDESVKVVVDADMPQPDEPIVVPDWSQMP